MLALLWSTAVSRTEPQSASPPPPYWAAQQAEGYFAATVSDQVTRRDGDLTGVLPGRQVRTA
jgi:N-acyl-D-aspartate/D-glutamate deacylase